MRDASDGSLLLMSTRPWRWFLIPAYVLFCIGLAAQQQPSTPTDIPKFVQEPCQPPVPSAVFGEKSDPNISIRVKQLFDEDQARESSAKNGKDWSVIELEDRKRQEEISRYLEKGQINSADDLYHAAMIFQHGNCVEHYRLANQLAEKAVSKGSNDAKWLYAATLDRYLMKQGKPQKFGTQFVKVEPEGKWQLYPVDPATTDEERARYNVPPLANQKQKVERLNAEAHR
jgi:hypothetical protein